MPEQDPLRELATVMAVLRRRCPWKAEQTHASLARYLLEEAHEVLEAIDLLDGAPGSVADLREELGDLLLQVYFHAAIAQEAGWFTIDDVATGILAKLYRRNPHVFGPEAGASQSPAAVDDVWQRIKATEKERTTLTDGLPPTLPALLLASKVLDRISRTSGHPAEVPALAGPAATDGDGDDAERELGDRLLALVAQGRSRGLDPEQALRRAVRRLAAADQHVD